MNFFGEVVGGPRTKRLEFGGDWNISWLLDVLQLADRASV